MSELPAPVVVVGAFFSLMCSSSFGSRIRT